MNLLTRLGLDINWDKVCPPSQEITFLGVNINTVRRTLSLPDEKLAELKSLVHKWTFKKRTSKRELLSFVGKLSWASRVVRGGRTFVRRLIDLSCKLKENHHRMWLNTEARADISWWQTGLELFHGNTPFLSDLRPPNSEFITDACPWGGGGYHESDWFYVNFEQDFPDSASNHINCLELLTILVGVRRWGHLWGGRHIQVRCDNTASVHSINKGSSRSPLFMQCLREIFWISTYFDFRLSAVHIRGADNFLADILSRLHSQEKRQKLCEMFNSSTGVINCFNNMSPKTFLFIQGFIQK